MLRIFWYAILATPSAQGIVLHSTQVAVPRNVSLMTKATNFAVPRNVSLMKALYEQLKRNYDAEKHGELSQNVTLVMGVFSVKEKENAYRQVIKDTWMKQNGVCWISQGQNTSCNVYVAFVVGGKDNPDQPNITNGLITKWRGMDELSLNVVENMDKGKSFEWLRYASNAFKWATHIGKMDMDTYPHFENITRLLSRKSSCQSYSGRALEEKNSYRKTCDSLIKKLNFFNLMDPLSKREYHPEKLPKNCVIVVQGGLYVLSRDLAQGASAHVENLSGYEDRMVGSTVHQYASNAKVCLVNHLGTNGFNHFQNHWNPT